MWQQDTGQSDACEWKHTRADPIAEVLRAHLDSSLASKIDTRIQAAYIKDENGNGKQYKRRAFRYLALTDTAKILWKRIQSLHTKIINDCYDNPQDEHLETILVMSMSAANTPDYAKYVKMMKARAPVPHRTTPTPEEGESVSTPPASPPPQKSRSPSCSPITPSPSPEDHNPMHSSPLRQRDTSQCESHFEMNNSATDSKRSYLDFFPLSRGPDQYVSKLRRFEGHIIHVLELYADTAPACTFAHKAQIAKKVRTLAVDWHSRPKASITTASDSDHTHEQFNLNQFESDCISIWSRRFWNIAAEQIDWIHVSWDCTTQSLASAARGTHRMQDGIPKSQEARRSDNIIAKSLAALDALVTRNPSILITAEQPQHSVITKHPSVRSLLVSGRWQILTSSHCKTADEALDGKVGLDDFSPALFPEKNTIWIVAGVPPYATLPSCQSNCKMLVEGQMYHRLLICNPASQGIKPGQRVMKLTENRGRIPLGTMKHLWNLHLEHRNAPDSADFECLRCGYELIADDDPLIICDNCERHIQHLSCSGFNSVQEIPELFLCRRCELVKQNHTHSDLE